jgi:hypothetical protein
MTVLLCIASAVAAWAVTLSYVSANTTRLREELTGQIRFWQKEAANARIEAAQAERDAITWAKGHKQGRDDAIKIMPLIAAAHERPAELSRGADDLTGQV